MTGRMRALRTGRTRLAAACLLVWSQAGPAAAFEIFGFRFFERDKPDTIDVLDPQTYVLRFEVLGTDSGLADDLRAESSLWRGRELPAEGGAGLAAKARSDYAAILNGLYLAGHYAGSIDIRVNGQEASTLTPFADFPDNVVVTVRVDPGPKFAFGDLRVDNPAPGAATIARETGMQPGATAGSGAISDYVGQTIDSWRARAHPKPELTAQEVVADHATNLLDVALAFDPGPEGVFGLTSVEGTNALDPEFVAYMAGLERGSAFDPETVIEGRDRLQRLDVFNAVRFVEGDTLVNGNEVPFQIVVQDRLPRQFGFGAEFSSFDGLGVEGFWLFRNVFGRAERLRFEAAIAGIDGTKPLDQYDFGLEAVYTVPGVWTPDTDLQFAGLLEHEILDAYDVDRASAFGGVNHVFNRDYSGSLFLQFERALFTLPDEEIYATTISLEAGVVRDTRNDILNASRGQYYALTAEPFVELTDDGNGISLEAEARAYRDLAGNGRFVLAGRAKLGSLLGISAASVTPDWLFFAGGSGSVRGYAFESVGTSYVNGIPQGGLSLAEASVELRAMLREDWGVVGFLDTGLVGVGTSPFGDARFLAGAGLGLRYLTVLGPLRLDLAMPINPEPQDSRYGFYIGIGQAF